MHCWVVSHHIKPELISLNFLKRTWNTSQNFPHNGPQREAFLYQLPFPYWPSNVDSPLPCFQAAHALCCEDLCWCPTLWHQRSPSIESKEITHHVLEIRHSQWKPSWKCSLQLRLESERGWEDAQWAPGLSDTFLWSQSLFWVREKGGLDHKGSGHANRSELGRSEDGRPGLQFRGCLMEWLWKGMRGKYKQKWLMSFQPEQLSG